MLSKASQKALDKIYYIGYFKCVRLGMLGAKEIIKEAQCLPVEERAIVIDSLLRSLNVSDTSIENKWIDAAKMRLAELRSGNVKPVSGDKVFARIKDVLSL